MSPASITLINLVLLFGSALALLGILSSVLATRFGIPLLLVFLAIGMFAGVDGPGGFQFENYELTYLIGSFALSVILFDGGLRTRLTSDLRRRRKPAALLASAGVLITAIITGLVAMWALELSWLEGFLLGSVVASTDAAAVFFLLRSGGLRLRQHVGSTLEMESATNDPAAVFLTLVATSALLAGADGFGVGVLGALLWQIVGGIAFGVAGGFAISWGVNSLHLPAGLHPLMVVASAVLIYAATSVTGGSGLLAVFLAGLVVGNRPMRAFANVTSFHDAATWLCQMVMFIVLGLLVTPSRLVEYLLPALVIALLLMVVARPVAVWLCFLPFNYSRKETFFVSLVGLRGAVSIFLAAIPTLAQIENADIYFNVAFVVVLVSLLVQGSAIRQAATRLGLAVVSKTRPPRRVELDLPGQLDLEMVGYPIVHGSPILAGAALPPWVRPVLIVRNREVVDAATAGALRPDDYAYFLAPPQQIHALDRLFAATDEPSP
ncbi:MAG: potassium/proton antiporter [Gammaproteobacteria bacterium]|nr:potassium/proton antiporter [Gammaproteobacteria bacterium]